MKKITFLLSFMLLLAFTAKGQKTKGYFKSSSNSTTLDTIVDTGVKTQVATIGGAHSVVGIQAVVTKTSGTVGGTLLVQGSLDGTNFATLASFTPTNVASQSFLHHDVPGKYTFYRISYTGTGTMVATLRTLWITKP